MLILVPLKPLVLVLGLLSGLVLIDFVGSSLLDGTNPFAVVTSQLQPAVGKQHDMRPTPERKYAHGAAPKRAQ